MNNKKLLATLAVAVAFAALPALSQPANPYIYVYEWTNVLGSANGIPSGKLFLDAPASSHGSLSDIGPGSYILVSSFPGPTSQIFFMNDPTLTTTLGDSVFTWNSTQVTEMQVNFSQKIGQETVQGGDVRENESNPEGRNGFDYFAMVPPPGQGFLADENIGSGSWVSASVVIPESADSILLLACSLTAIAIFQARQKAWNC